MTIWKTLDGLTDAVLALTLAVVSVLITTNVVLRYVFNTSLMWSTEISGGLLVWITFLGAFRCSRQQSHLVVDLLSEHCSDRARHRLAVLRSTIQGASFVVLAYLSLHVTQLVGGSSMQTLDWPIGIWFTGIFLGFVLLTLSEARDLTKLLWQKHA